MVVNIVNNTTSVWGADKCCHQTPLCETWY